MKEKAIQMLRESIEWYYTYKYSKPYNKRDVDDVKNEMGVVYETLRDLGLVTLDEYRAMKAEVRGKLKQL